MDGDRENAYYVTVSAGIFVMCRDKKISTEDTLSRADERLYEAKKHKTQMLIKQKRKHCSEEIKTVLLFYASFEDSESPDSVSSVASGRITRTLSMRFLSSFSTTRRI